MITYHHISYTYIHIHHIDIYMYVGAVVEILASGNGRFAKRNFPFRETFAASFAGHFLIIHDRKDDASNSSFPGHGPRPMLEAFSFVATIADLSRILREIVRVIS